VVALIYFESADCLVWLLLIVKFLNLFYQKQSTDPQRIGNRISQARTLFEISNVHIP
jgi:hypothetical protein